ncbi:MAG TPA: RuBisCO large subunit C-terminal-like domain-containing protein [Gemmatimonadales bacterium]|nr:RuBisCO large subunit C-terminal-like domain-containing protein [Gemmatimonadales bacterium]
MTATPLRLRITYHLAGSTRAAAARARDLAFEQTVELPPDAVSPEIAARFAGRVESVRPLGRRRSRAVVSFDPAVVCGDLPQLLNLLFGNISLKAGILIAAVDWPEPLLAQLGGPRLGIPGLRALAGVPARPLVCAALKPLGLSPASLADHAAVFARAGIDIIKDDHSLVDQASAPFRERVERCQEAVVRANGDTGGNTLYFPNVTGGPRQLLERVEFARRVGCRGAVVNALPAGLGAAGAIADAGLAVMAHPSLGGAFFGPDHGIAPAVLLGDLFRVAGSDAVIYPNVGGRFTFSHATCRAINARLRGPLGPVLPAFPVPAGGIDAARVPHWVERYGPDTIFLLGSSLYRDPDPGRAARRLAEAVRRRAHG